MIPSLFAKSLIPHSPMILAVFTLKKGFYADIAGKRSAMVKNGPSTN